MPKSSTSPDLDGPSVSGGRLEQPAAAAGGPVKPVAVYRLRDAQGRLLYVGISSNPDHRLHSWDRSHSVDAVWWPEVVEPAEVTWYPDRQAALAAEKEAIQTEHPLHNRNHQVAPPDDWEWAGYVAPADPEVLAMMRTRKW